MTIKYPVSALSLVLVLAASAFGQDYSVAGNGKNIRLTVRAVIHRDLPGFIFKIDAVRPDDYSVSAHRISIFRNDAKETPVQTLEFEATDTSDGERLGFYVEDMDFDGYADIRIQLNNPAAPNNSYYCWVYDPVQGAFRRDCALEGVISPVFDQEKKLVHSYERVSAAEHLSFTYAYVNGALTLIRETRERYDPETGERIVTAKELKNGKWIAGTTRTRE